jgi:NNP family nitrate/nitrite transporter-like MFS transporter
MPFAMTKQGARPGSPSTVFAAFLHFDMCFTMWVLLGALGVFIAGPLKLDDAQKGLMVAIPVLSGSLFRVPVGILGDRFGGKLVGIIMLVFLFIPLVLGWFIVPDFGLLLIIGAMLGVAGSSFAIALPLASRWYPPEKQGLVMGIAAAGNLGTVIAIIFAPVIAYAYTPKALLPYTKAAVPAHGKVAAIPAKVIYPLVPAPGGWHAVMGFTLIILAIVLVVFIIMAKEPPRPKGVPVAVYLRALKKANVWWFCLLYSITFGGFVGLGSYLSLFFNGQYGLPPTVKGYVTLATASGLAALAAFAGSTLRPVGGYVADKVGGSRTLTVLLVIVTIVYALAGVLIWFSLPLVYMAIIMVVGVGCLGMGNGAVFQMVPQSFRKELGVVTGLVGCIGGIGGFALPFLLGSVKQATGSYAIGWFILSGFVLFALVVLRVLMAKHSEWRTSWAGTTQEDAVESAPIEGVLDPTLG